VKKREKAANDKNPAILGGNPAFENTLPIVRPPIAPHVADVLRDFKKILRSGMITNYEFVQRLERDVAQYIGVKHCVAVANCTSGLMLTLKALNIKDGEVLLPSFTFPATAHVVHWNNLKIKLVDCDFESFNMEVTDLNEKLTARSKIIMPVHVFGNPCNISAITEIAKDRNLKVIFDSAHGFGAEYNRLKIGQFGDSEVFSGSPTKAFTTVEGGLIASDNSEIARKVRMGRNYGHLGDYNCEMQGLSARMSEFHAALGLRLLSDVDFNIKRRNKIAVKYRRELSKIPGIGFQKITSGATSTYKDFAILIDKNKFGLDRDQLSLGLEKENIMTRKYFYPPLHKQSCYPELQKEEKSLPNSNFVSRNVLCLPMFADLPDNHVRKIAETIHHIHDHAEEILIKLRAHTLNRM